MSKLRLTALDPQGETVPFESMTCSKCRVKMIEKKRSYHKQRKWVCPRCGAARMQIQRQRPSKSD